VSAEPSPAQNVVMTPEARPADLASLAGLLADSTRAAFCLALLDGRAWTAGELARHAGVAPSTASEHLDRLIAGGLLAEERQGRHRYVRLAGSRVAELIEDLTAHLDPAGKTPAGNGPAGQAPAGERPRTLRAVTASAALARGRTCYDHLAGRLGVAVTDAMTGAGLLEQSSGFGLTADGVGWLGATLGVKPATLATTRRPLARGCLDWTERRPHLAGVAGARLCQHFLDRGWIVRVSRSRAVRVSPAGETALRDLLGVDTAALA
jgi:DNA-binding transcriptional ArsR family regulator